MDEPVNGSRPQLLIHSLEAHRMGDGLGDGLGHAVLRRLSQRAVLLSTPSDTVIVDSQPDPRWISMMNDLGIGLGEIRIATGSGDTLVDRIMTDRTLMGDLVRKGPQWTVAPYMGGEQIKALTDRIDARYHAPEITLLDRLNLKSNLGPILHETGLPAISTTIACRDAVVAVSRSMLTVHGKLVVPADLSIGGHGVWMIETESDLDTLEQGSQRSTPDRLFVIQPKHSVTSSPNVQYDITESGATLLGVSDQQMTASFAFGGNDFPSTLASDHRILDQGSRLSAWLHAAGYRGMVGLDFIITEEGNAFIVEINPRVNTSTFPLLLAKRLGRRAFRLITGIQAGGVRGLGGVADLLGDGVMYDGQRGDGVIPLMIPSTERPVLDVMAFADSLDETDRVGAAMNQRLKERGLVGSAS